MDTTGEATRPATFGLDQAFGSVDGTHGDCCAYCEGYCPATDPPDHPLPDLYRVGDYITDRYVAVRAGLLDVPDKQRFAAAVGASAMGPAMVVPDTQPGESWILHRPACAARLLALGFTIAGGEDDDQSAVQHLYLDGEHVGWVMGAPPHSPVPRLTVPEVRALIELDKELPYSTWRVLTRMPGHRIDNLATLVQSAREVTEVLDSQR